MIPIDSLQFALSGSCSDAGKRNMKMARWRTVWCHLALLCVDARVKFG